MAGHVKEHAIKEGPQAARTAVALYSCSTLARSFMNTINRSIIASQVNAAFVLHVGTDRVSDHLALCREQRAVRVRLVP